MTFYQSRLLLACLGLAFIIRPGLAGPTPIISYDSLPDRIRKLNPDLAAARFRIAEAAGQLQQSGRLTNPTLNLQTTHGLQVRERSLTVGFSQKFPVTDRLRLERALGETQLRQALAEVREVERQLIAEARQALVSYLALSQRRRLLKAQIELSQEFSQSLEKLAEKGEVSVLDAGQARLLNMQIKTELRALDAREKTINGALKPLLGMGLTDPLMVGGKLEELGIPAFNTNLDQRGDVQAARHSIQRAITKVALEEARRYADIQVSGFASLNRVEDAPIGFENEGVLGIGFSIPLPLWNKNEGNIETAKAQVQRRRGELTALENRVLHQSKASLEEMQEWAALVREIEQTLIPEADKQLKLAEDSYHQGLTNIQTVLRSREQALKLQSSRLDALESFHKTRASFESLQGR